jgi:8-oxo-dGTP pyrophosphatase MutT (NUDIX family)
MEQGPILSPGDDLGGPWTRQEIIRRLASRRGLGVPSAARIAESLGDGAAADLIAAARPAAVLVPLVARPQGLTVLFTQRTDHLENHAGQVSFPGGRQEDADVDAVACALRETEEETGLSPERVEILGRLDDCITITRFRVVPIVGLVHPPFTLSPDPYEVAEVFEVPLSFILDEDNHRRGERHHDGKPRPYVAIPYQGHCIWGATAGMLVNLCRVLAD